MSEYFSGNVEEGIRLVWMQFDKEKALEGRRLLLEAAKEGDKDAYCFLARTYFGVNGLEEDRDTAFELLQKSRELGSACGLLTMLQFEKLAKKTFKIAGREACMQAAKEVREKAEGGHVFCQYIMGLCYFWGGYLLTESFQDPDDALDERIPGALFWLEKALKGGLTLALVNLSDLYSSLGEEKKLEEAMKLAAEKGDPFWQELLADRLFEEERYKEAFRWYERLAEAGDIKALYDMGFQYEHGMGIEASPEKALAAYEVGAKQGMQACQLRLGKLNLWGKFVPKDEAQAYHWFSQAAEEEEDGGDETNPICELAKMWKGHCLLYGLGVKKDEDGGTDLLYAALDYNFPGKGEDQEMLEESQFDWKEDVLQLFWDLGDAYENGLGVPVKEHNAGYYFSILAEEGWPEAIEKMKHYRQGGLLKRWKRIK
ncbi:MAG: hypothetical protein QM657_04245 [Lacrimispora sp.]|uniref:tetratricopeptide repeat protein n=1 Tax=Lacrimispora sp. TaxID=2719234 RepID=UPI0039E32F42